MGALRIFISELAAGLALLCGAAAAAGAIAAQAGRKNPMWDVAAHFAPVWVLLGLGALLLALVSARGGVRWLALAFSVSAVVAAGQLIGHELLRPTSPRAEPNAPHQIKLIQFNAWRDNVDLDRAARWIAAQEPDVVVIQEGSPAVAAAMHRHGNWRAACERCSVMIFSRVPLEKVRLQRPDGLALPSTVGARLRAPDGGAYTVVGVHYTWPTNVRKHERQVAGLTKALKPFPSDRLIVAGDFNSTPWSAARRRQDAELGLERRTKALLTWPARTYERWGLTLGMPILPIDHIYAGAAWRTVEVQRGPELGSDHYPVVARFALAP